MVGPALIADCVPSQCSRKAVCSDFLCREGSDLLDCSVGGLRVGSAAVGVRCCGEGLPSLLDQLCGDGFCGDSAAEASLGALTHCQGRPTTASADVLAKRGDGGVELCRRARPAELDRR